MIRPTRLCLVVLAGVACGGEVIVVRNDQGAGGGDVAEPLGGGGASDGGAGGLSLGGAPRLPPPCQELAESGTLVSVSMPPGHAVDQLTFAQHGGGVAPVVQLAPLGNMAPYLVHSDLDAFGGAWPPVIAPFAQLALGAAERFAVRGNQDASYALLMPLHGGPMGPAMLYADDIVPGQPYMPGPMPSAPPPVVPPGAAQFVVPTSPAVFGHVFGAGNSFQLALTASGGATQTILDSGCASSPILADGVSVDDGWLVATSSGRPFGTCLNDDQVSGPPTRAQVGLFDGQTWALSSEIETQEPVANLALAPRSDGAWLVTRPNGETSFTPPAAVALRLDSQGGSVGSMFFVVPEGTPLGPIAVGSLGDELVVAYVDTTDPGPATIVVRVFDDEGDQVAEQSVASPDVFSISEIAMSVDPDERKILIGWTRPTDAAAPVELLLTRLDCFSISP